MKHQSIWLKMKPFENVKCDSYEVSDEGEILDIENQTLVETYIASTGYVYAMLKINPSGYKIFIVNKIVATTFEINCPSFLIGKQLMIKHKNGDKSDVSINNLEWVEDIELWRDLGSLGFKPGLWYVSNHGNVYGTRYKKSIKPNIRNGYPSINITQIDGNQKPVSLHRLIGLLFIPKTNENANIINHIDGNKLNSHFLNLEWTDVKGNTEHAIRFGFMTVTNKPVIDPKLTEFEVRKICELIMLYNGNVRDVVNHANIPNATYFNVRAIRNGQSWSHISADYFKPRTYITRNMSDIIDENKCREICALLVENDMNIRRVYEYYSNDNSITYDKIRCIAYKKSWKKISDEYF